MPDGTSDTSFWRIASFSQVCSSSSLANLLELRYVYGLDELFLNEPARLACQTFRKFKEEKDAETTFLSIMRLDAIITDVIDSFA